MRRDAGARPLVAQATPKRTGGVPVTLEQVDAAHLGRFAAAPPARPPAPAAPPGGFGRVARGDGPRVAGGGAGQPGALPIGGGGGAVLPPPRDLLARAADRPAGSAAGLRGQGLPAPADE